MWRIFRPASKGQLARSRGGRKNNSSLALEKYGVTKWTVVTAQDMLPTILYLAVVNAVANNEAP